jgi:hypothetical protein
VVAALAILATQERSTNRDERAQDAANPRARSDRVPTYRFPGGVTIEPLPPPPADFDPVTADAAALRHHALPARPALGDPQRAAWMSTWAEPARFISPRVRRTSKRLGVMSALEAATDISDNWSGAVLRRTGGASFIEVEGTWTHPALARSPSGAHAASVATWVGIDGADPHSPTLYQAGTYAQRDELLGVHHDTHFAWVEWIPDNMIEIVNFPVASGDTIACQVTTALRYETFLAETATAFTPESDGVWTLGHYDLAERRVVPDLVFIKTSNTGSGKTEVHIASARSNYQARILDVASTFEVMPAGEGIWLLADWDGDGVTDLVYVKTTNTGTNRTEVHVASGSSKYQTRILEIGTTFEVMPPGEGTWLLADYDRDGKPDLVYVKTKNTGTGRTEVHIASGKSNYQTRILEVGSAFEVMPPGDGAWSMADYDGDGIPDLVYIKNANTATGSVEVHIASGASRYATRILDVASAFAPEADGTWLMAQYRQPSDHGAAAGDNVADLVFIKTANTGSGKVEVHAVSGAGSDTTGTVAMRNLTKRISTAMRVRAPAGVHLLGASAEWIVERPSTADKNGTNIAMRLATTAPS